MANQFLQKIKSRWIRAIKYRDFKVDPAFEDRFSREIAKTELQRVNLLLSIIVLGFLAGMVNLYLSRNDSESPQLSSVFFGLLGGVVVLVCYELIVRIYITQCIRYKKPLSLRYQVINLVIESLFPTVVAFVLIRMSESIFVYFSPITLLYFLFIILSTLRLNLRFSILCGLLSAIGYYAVSRFIVDMNMVKDAPVIFFSEVLILGRAIILILCGIASGFVALEIKRRMYATFLALNERNRIREVLGQQVSHAIVDRIINEQMEIDNKKQMVCVMFVDIRNFTPFAEKKMPEEVLDYQNKIFGVLIDVIDKQNGIINQFLGDGLMATFGAPISSGNDCEHAGNAAIEILDRIQESVDKGIVPKTRLGIGIHYGEAITGNVGTELRKQFSIVGNVVIQASRIEQLNKEFQSQLLMSKEVYDRMGSTGGESLGHVMLKGESEPLEIIRIR